MATFFEKNGVLNSMNVQSKRRCNIYFVIFVSIGICLVLMWMLWYPHIHTIEFIDAMRYISMKQPSCDPLKEQQRFVAAGGGWSTSCPNNTVWLKKFAEIDPDPNKTMIVIGCNKGVDAVDLFAEYDNSYKPFKSDIWRQNIISQNLFLGDGACNQVIESPRLDRNQINTDYPRISPLVYCVEPMNNNIQLLNNIIKLSGINEKYFKIKQYAIGNVKNETTANFPDGGRGAESWGIQKKANNQTVKVSLSSLDLLFNDVECVDILSVDAEGHDPEALYGGKKTLKKTRYLEFEVHRNLGHTAWRINTLEDVIRYLDGLGFDCFWANRNGQLFQITNCWHSEYEQQAFSWSNVVCVKRNDRWHKVLKTIHKQQALSA